MAQDLSIEDPEMIFFGTIRTVDSRLWLVNNDKLIERIKAYLAKYLDDYGAECYGIALMGNHYHLLIKFPLGNKSAFFRDFNAMIAKLTKRLAKNYEGGRLWARRVRCQFVLEPADVENWFFYMALNPIASGLGQKLSDYPCYNSFSNAISGKTETFKIVDWTDYENRRRTNKKLTIAECTKTYELKFARLPGYEHLSHREYRELMLKKFEARRIEVLRERAEKGLGYVTREQLLETVPGSKPKTTKTSSRHTHRPLCLTLCREARQRFLEWYFELREMYLIASKRFREGDLSVIFPPGTYRPPSAVCVT